MDRAPHPGHRSRRQRHNARVNRRCPPVLLRPLFADAMLPRTRGSKTPRHFRCCQMEARIPRPRSPTVRRTRRSVFRPLVVEGHRQGRADNKLPLRSPCSASPMPRRGAGARAGRLSCLRPSSTPATKQSCHRAGLASRAPTSGSTAGEGGRSVRAETRFDSGRRVGSGVFLARLGRKGRRDFAPDLDRLGRYPKYARPSRDLPAGVAR